MSTRECRELRAELAAFADGRVTSSERLRVQAHLDQCAVCRSEVAMLSSSIAQLRVVDPVRLSEMQQTPIDLNERVVSTLRSHREQTKAHAEASDTTNAAIVLRRHRPRAKRSAAALLFAAAASTVTLAAMVGLVGLVVSRHGEKAVPRTVALVASEAGARAHVELASIPSGTNVHFQATGLDTGKTYWLWLTGSDGKRVGAGTVVARPDGRVDAHTACAVRLGAVRRVWVTEDDHGTVLDAKLD